MNKEREKVERDILFPSVGGWLAEECVCVGVGVGGWVGGSPGYFPCK